MTLQRRHADPSPSRADTGSRSSAVNGFTPSLRRMSCHEELWTEPVPADTALQPPVHQLPRPGTLDVAARTAGASPTNSSCATASTTASHCAVSASSSPTSDRPYSALASPASTQGSQPPQVDTCVTFRGRFRPDSGVLCHTGVHLRGERRPTREVVGQGERHQAEDGSGGSAGRQARPNPGWRGKAGRTPADEGRARPQPTRAATRPPYRPRVRWHLSRVGRVPLPWEQQRRASTCRSTAPRASDTCGAGSC